MSRMPRTHVSAVSPSASPQLLVAALSGLLCMASCSLEDPHTTTTNGGQPAVSGAGGTGDTTSAGTTATSGSAGTGGTEDAGGAGGVPGAGVGGAADSAGGVGAAGAPTVTDAGGAGAGGLRGDGGGEALGAAGAGGAVAEPPHITSSQSVADMTVEKFTALCDERGGTVEVMVHCNGLATAKGFSYDSTTGLLSEHTCQGANTCEGWNCILD